MVPLTIADAEFFKEACELIVLEGKPLTEKLKKYRDETLVKKLEKPIEDVCKKGSGFAFVKNSCRSPKDAPILLEKELRETWRRLMKDKDPKDGNDRILAMLEAGTEMLKVNSAKRAIELMLRSKRQLADMKIAINQKHRFKENFVIRQHEDIDAMLELRGIVFNNSLNALSQYHAAIFIPDFVKKQKEIISAVQAFFEKKVKPRMAKWKHIKGNYVADFAFRKGKPYRPENIFVIEINPYLMNTDACLFQWSRDQKTFESGPLEFRCNEKPSKNLGITLEGPWKKVLDDETKKLLASLKSAE